MTLTLNDILTIAGIAGGAAVAILGVVVPILFQMNSTINRRFDDAQRANDQAHVRIGENIKSLERRVDSLERRIEGVERRIDNGLSNVHTQLAAITPRAAAEPGPPDAA